MQIIPFSTQIPTLGPISTATSSAPAPLLDEDRDKVELSGERPPLLGQAESLPGQGKAPETVGLGPGHLLGADPAEDQPSAQADEGRVLAEGGSAAHPLEQSPESSSEIEDRSDEAGEADEEAAEASEERDLTGQALTDDERQEVDRLKERDREVRTHEQAHVAAGGQYVRGGVQLEYQTGPDGRRYAVGGEVSIDSSPVAGDPQKTIQKAQQIRRAATAPAEPSGQDQRVAVAASQMEAQARQDLIQERIDGGGEGAASDEPVVGETPEEGVAVAEVDPSVGEASSNTPSPGATVPSLSGDVEDSEATLSPGDSTGTGAVVEGSAVTGSFGPPSFDLVPTGDDEVSGPFGEAASPLDPPKIDRAGPAGGVVTLSYAREAASPAGSFVDLYR